LVDSVNEYFGERASSTLHAAEIFIDPISASAFQGLSMEKSKYKPLRQVDEEIKRYFRNENGLQDDVPGASSASAVSHIRTDDSGLYDGRRSHSHEDARPFSLSHQELQEKATRRRYLYACCALAAALATFVIQTETANYLAMTLQYKKPIFMLYVTHSSWCLLWPLQICILRLRKWKVPFREFLRGHLANIYSTASLIAENNVAEPISVRRYFIRIILTICVALNLAGSSWYLAINLTTAGDLTAIYNCSAFFAYAFSVPLLKEPFRWDKIFSVLLSIVGVVVVAYSGSGQDESQAESSTSLSRELFTSSSATSSVRPVEYPHRTLGNIVIGIGAVLYGLYEVLYKRLACPPQQVSARRQAAFANVIGSAVGLCTFCILWPIIPLLHFTGIETFELPHGEEVWVFTISVISNALFSGSFLTLMALTSPVLSSVAALLTTFLVAVVDWLLFGTMISFGGVIGGILIIVAFVLLSYASWKELQEESDDESDVILRADDH
jgi:drug/metabolite transporter (DMT)-like permease